MSAAHLKVKPIVVSGPEAVRFTSRTTLKDLYWLPEGEFQVPVETDLGGVGSAVITLKPGVTYRVAELGDVYNIPVIVEVGE